MQEKKSVTKHVRSRYLKAGRKEKSAILDEFIMITGYKNRKYAMRILNKPETAETLLIVKGNAFNHAGLVIPSGTASQVSVTGNTRNGSGETDVRGAEVVFGNKGFGDDRTENNLIVGGKLTVGSDPAYPS
jgi:hypothetical protein